ncbi:43615_t:CDS:2 [Gigaspora margarita]|uniref:43615_t:CDS:1 n=1 Tax=Gigaspora margarita TaxID=4874 RepID=A0ABM8W159_GIGMA|nr:43615_t:CDS:2 [Gigaspora margarita]
MVQQTIYNVQKLENLKKKSEPIKEYIIIFDNVINSETIITEPKEIKNVIKEHFYRWTRANPMDEKKFKE